jgi:capsular exopolysaccharide synthesis family protein
LAQYDINLREYWRILKKRKLIVILISAILGIFSIVFAFLRAPEPIYATTCVIKFEKQTTLENVLGLTISWSEPQDIVTQTSMIKSYAVFQRAAEKIGLIPKQEAETTVQLDDHTIALIEGLQQKVEVTQEGVSNLIQIQVVDRNPGFAQKLANTVALAFKELHAEEQVRRNSEALKYIVFQLKDVREKLRRAEDEFNNFSRENELVSIDLQSESLLARAQEMQGELRKLEEDKMEFEILLQRLEAFLKDPYGSDHDFYSTKGSVQYEKANETLVAHILKRDTLLKDFTTKHPDVVAVNNQIIETARKMAFLLSTQLRFLEKRESDLRADLNKVSGKTRVLMDQKLEFDRLKRKVDLYNEMTVLLERKNQEALIQRAGKPEEVTIVKPALLPSRPINPPKTMATGAMGIMIGLVLGLVVAFVVETFDTSLGAIEDVEETLGTQVLGIVPQADLQDIRESLQEKHSGVGHHALRHAVSLISHFSPKSMMAESFRALRTNIQFKDPEKKIKAVAVTSSSPEEGKTLVATNLAITMAQGGMKTLLIGSDLRKPVLNRIFGVEKSPGLTDILLGNYPWRDTIKSVTDIIMGKLSLDEIMITPGLDNLHMVTSGAIPPNPAELIDSQRLIDFIEEAKKEYDIIIFDSSPILSTADAAILAGRVDGVFLVYRVGSVSRGLLKRASTQLEQVQCHLMGVILNGMRPDLSPDFHDYKYYSYYYSYGEEGEDKKGGDKRGGFPLFKKKEDTYEATQEIRLDKVASERKKEPEKKPGGVRWVLMLIALVFLAGGLLWQNNVIHPFWRSNSKEPATAPTVPDSTPQKVAFLKEPERVPEQTPAVGPATAPAVPDAPPRKTLALKGSEGVPEEAATVKSATVPTIQDSPARKTSALRGIPGTPEKAPSLQTPAPQVVKPMPDTLSLEEELSSADRKPGSDATASVEKKPEQRPSEPFPSLLQGARAPVQTESPTYPYSLYLGSLPYPDQAEEEVLRYKRRGVDAHWVKVILSKGTWYRVYTGYFQNRQEAESFKQEKGLEKATVQETPWANLIGIYADPKTLEDKIRLLKRLGFSPYFIEDGDGESELYVGVFYPERRAKRQYDDLKAKGIENQVVKR